MKNYEKCLKRLNEYMSGVLSWKLNSIRPTVNGEYFEINISESPSPRPTKYETHTIYYNVKKDIFFNDQWSNLEEI